MCLSALCVGDLRSTHSDSTPPSFCPFCTRQPPFTTTTTTTTPVVAASSACAGCQHYAAGVPLHDVSAAGAQGCQVSSPATHVMRAAHAAFPVRHATACCACPSAAAASCCAQSKSCELCSSPTCPRFSPPLAQPTRPRRMYPPLSSHYRRFSQYCAEVSPPHDLAAQGTRVAILRGGYCRWRELYGSSRPELIDNAA